ncbi:hypothetical protein V1525DRAFT_428881 [Lipomyces kononenkoae]|uniref:Uncharacterized protein n=1 Tax=Lipomyces kononenkoae TaxID=34357 RepID=A0ACC3SQ52_LIPKO
MTRELGTALCNRLWRVTKTLQTSKLDLEKLSINIDDILVQIDSQKTYVLARPMESFPAHLQQVRLVADNIERLMIERNYELEQVHTRLRGHKDTQAKEISRYNAMVDALPITAELRPEKIGDQFFRLDNFGMAHSDVPLWVTSREVRNAIQFHLQIQALQQEIDIIRAEVTRAMKWATENLRALIAYARANESGQRSEAIFVDKLWAGVQVARNFVENLDSMYSECTFLISERPYLGY